MDKTTSERRFSMLRFLTGKTEASAALKAEAVKLSRKDEIVIEVYPNIIHSDRDSAGTWEYKAIINWNIYIGGSHSELATAYDAAAAGLETARKYQTNAAGELVVPQIVFYESAKDHATAVVKRSNEQKRLRELSKR